MHFVTFNKSTGAQFAQYASFYKDKFPKVFQEPVDADDEDSDSNEEVEVTWKSSEAEGAFKNFDKKMSQITKKGDGLALLTYLLEFKSFIVQLPVSTKEAECTIQRFILYLLPIFKFAEEQSYIDTRGLLEKYIDVLTRSEFPLSAKIAS